MGLSLTGNYTNRNIVVLTEICMLFVTNLPDRIALTLYQYCKRGQPHDMTAVTKHYGTGQLSRIVCGRRQSDLNHTPAMLNLTVVFLGLSQQMAKLCLDQTIITRSHYSALRQFLHNKTQPSIYTHLLNKTAFHSLKSRSQASNTDHSTQFTTNRSS